jgi:hypothetical protein
MCTSLMLLYQMSCKNQQCHSLQNFYKYVEIGGVIWFTFGICCNYSLVTLTFWLQLKIAHVYLLHFIIISVFMTINDDKVLMLTHSISL